MRGFIREATLSRVSFMLSLASTSTPKNRKEPLLPCLGCTTNLCSFASSLHLVPNSPPVAVLLQNIQSIENTVISMRHWSHNCHCDVICEQVGLCVHSLREVGHVSKKAVPQARAQASALKTHVRQNDGIGNCSLDGDSTFSRK